MSLLLALETSSKDYRVVIGRDGNPIFDSALSARSSRSLAGVVTGGLEETGCESTQIGAITVNVGPGALTYVRAGISFANALAFSLAVRIIPFNWFEIIAAQTKMLTALPVIGAVPAAKGQAYIGLMQDGSVKLMRYGPLPAVVELVCEGLSELAVAGRIRHEVSTLLNKSAVSDTGIDDPNAEILLGLGNNCWTMDRNLWTQVGALNDQSEIFYERTSVRN